ncbi:MAG: ATP-binding cassette domain-containing protein [Lentisphaeraceae bacterium]|nr:ATP-binding cassette domain-containing protein [Lentisphaeraceae bacterium]
MSKEFLWTLEDISVNGIQQKRLNSICLNIPPGMSSIIGWSGAGKSTLIDLLSGQIEKSSGNISRNFQNENSPIPLYIVPQNFGLWPQLSVMDHILKSMPTKDKVTAENLLTSFDLQEKTESSIDQLSQGECSRLAVARALATEAQVILMDEPLSNVDPSRKSSYWKIIQEYALANKRSVIFSTHEPSEALAYSQNSICLHKGSLVSSGNTYELYNSPKDELTASLLGPGNWLDNENFANKVKFCRPENLRIEESEQGEYAIIKSTFFGHYSRSELNNGKSYFHTSPKVLAKGMKVIITLLLVLLYSCTPKSESTLTFSEVTSWNMPASGQKLPGPRAVSPGLNDQVIVMDDAGRLLLYDENGKELKRWNMPDTELGHPEGATVFADGRIAVADTHYARVVIFNEDGTVQSMFGTRGSKEGQFYSPVGIALDDKENIYVCEYGKNDRIQKFTKDGKFIISFGSAGTGDGQLQRASDLIWFEGKIYVADAVNNRVQVFSDEGKFIKVLTGEDSNLYMPYDIDMSPDGFLYIAEYGHSRISKVSFEGKVLGHFGSPGTELNQFKTPWGIAVSSKGIVYVADTGNRRVTKLKP